MARPEVQSLDPVDQAALLRERQDDAKWTVIVGVALLFGSGISAYIGAGGAAMCVWGITKYLYWGARAKAAYDPWKDSDLDTWEDEQYPR